MDDDSGKLYRELMDVFRQIKKSNFYTQDATLTPGELMLLNTLKRSFTSGQGIKASELSEKLNVTRSSITQTLGNLEQAGYIIREMDESDRRSIRVKMTEKGEELYIRHAKEMIKMVSELSEYLGKEEVEHLIETFKKVNNFLKARRNLK